MALDDYKLENLQIMLVCFGGLLLLFIVYFGIFYLWDKHRWKNTLNSKGSSNYYNNGFLD